MWSFILLLWRFGYLWRMSVTAATVTLMAAEEESPLLAGRSR